MPQFSPESVIRILEKHALPISVPEKGEFEGVVNEVWFCGDLVVRINKDLDFESDVWTESVSVPTLTAHGVLTPQLVVFDSDLDIVPRLVTIYVRVPGVSLKRVWELDDSEAFFFDLRAAIRSFHDRVTQVSDPDKRLDPEWTTDYPKALAKLEDLFPESRGLFPRDLAFDSTQKVFAHQDLHADNIMVHSGKLAAIIDWGDAGWASAAVDLRYIPIPYLDSALRGYGALSETDRINLLIHQVEQFVYAKENGRSYGVYGDSTGEEIMGLVDLLKI